MTRPKQSGFSAIEALAALAIVAVALLPLLSLQAQLSRDFARQRAIYLEASATRSALALVREINPMDAPSGALPIGESGTLRWGAEPISAPTRTTRAGAGEGDFLVQLFRLEVSVADANGAQIASFSVEQLGWGALTDTPIRTGARPLNQIN